MLLSDLFENDLIPQSAAAVATVRAVDAIVGELSRRGASNIQAVLHYAVGGGPFVSIFLDPGKMDVNESMKPFIRAEFKKHSLPYKWKMNERVKNFVRGCITLTPDVAEMDTTAAAKEVAAKKLRVKVNGKRK